LQAKKEDFGFENRFTKAKIIRIIIIRINEKREFTVQ